MMIWTSFFLVLSVVILAYPFLTPGDGSRGGGTRPDKNSPDLHSSDIYSPWHEEEVKLDLATGRLGPIDDKNDDRPAGDDPVEMPVSSEEDNGSLPEGSTAQ